MKYFSMFTGIGGFELGMQQAYESNIKHAPVGQKSKQEKRKQGGFGSVNKREVLLHLGSKSAPLCLGFSEIDKYANQLLQIKFPTVKNYGNATTIDEKQLPDFDLLVGGFPCQTFSIAGKRKGFADTRGTLFFDIARILSYKKPRYVLLENVKGLLSHDGGRTFQTIIGVLTDLGYFVEWQVLNSKNFGVPQNRERVFIIGYFGKQPKSKVFSIEQGNGKNENTIKRLGHMEGFRRYNQTYDDSGLVEALDTSQGGGHQPCVLQPETCIDCEIDSIMIKNLPDIFDSNNMVALTEKRTEESKKIRKEMMKKGKDWSPRRGKVLEKRTDGKMNNLTANQTKEHYLSDGLRIRRLTPLECERLQGFPDNWTQGFSDAQRYKMCGNAVTVNVVKYVINRLFYKNETN